LEISEQLANLWQEYCDIIFDSRWPVFVPPCTYVKTTKQNKINTTNKKLILCIGTELGIS